MSLLVSALSVAGVYAQKNTVLVYGAVGAQSSKPVNGTKVNSFNFSPAVGYQFTDNWTAGLALSSENSKTTTSLGDIKSYGMLSRSLIFLPYMVSSMPMFCPEKPVALRQTGFAALSSLPLVLIWRTGSHWILNLAISVLFPKKPKELPKMLPNSISILAVVPDLGSQKTVDTWL